MPVNKADGQACETGREVAQVNGEVPGVSVAAERKGFKAEPEDPLGQRTYIILNPMMIGDTAMSPRPGIGLAPPAEPGPAATDPSGLTTLPALAGVISRD